jgi:pantoate kinase
MEARVGAEFVTGERARNARAFAPAHVTGIFRPADAGRDPRARGSLGAGIVLELGVHAGASYRPGGPRRIRFSSDARRPLPISEEAARRLFPPGNGTLTVRLRHELPIGQGFGLSAAGATATALAVGRLFGRPRSAALETAHLADLFGAGGLGGVASIVGGGGLEFRRRAGIPPWGEVEHRPLPGRLFVGVVGGPIPSPAVLGSPRALGRIERASEDLDDLLARPSVPGFLAASERFTDRVGLAPPAVRTAIRALRRRGARAGQAMFGRSFFARPEGRAARAAVVEWLRMARIPAVELEAARTGARIRVAPASSGEPF